LGGLLQQAGVGALALPPGILVGETVPVALEPAPPGIERGESRLFRDFQNVAVVLPTGVVPHHQAPPFSVGGHTQHTRHFSDGTLHSQTIRGMPQGGQTDLTPDLPGPDRFQ
jgi:hypothetical protein